MTEAEWLATTDPEPMLEVVRGKVSDRKLRLLAVACVRRLWHLLSDERSREAVQVAELYADGSVSEESRGVACQSAANREATASGVTANSVAAQAVVKAVSRSHDTARMARAATSDTAYAVGYAASAANTDFVTDPYSEAAWHNGHQSELKVQSNLLHDIFGNPFRPITFASSWRPSAVVALASQMYESRDFSAMPILADALQDAGCDMADVLDHCRGPGPHVRGCWVVDLVLGKE